MLSFWYHREAILCHGGETGKEMQFMVFFSRVVCRMVSNLENGGMKNIYVSNVTLIWYLLDVYFVISIRDSAGYFRIERGQRDLLGNYHGSI